MNEEEDAALKVPKRERMGIFEGMDSRRAREVAGHTNPLELVKKLSITDRATQLPPNVPVDTQSSDNRLDTWTSQEEKKKEEDLTPREELKEVKEEEVVDLESDMTSHAGLEVYMFGLIFIILVIAMLLESPTSTTYRILASVIHKLDEFESDDGLTQGDIGSADDIKAYFTDLLIPILYKPDPFMQENKIEFSPVGNIKRERNSIHLLSYFNYFTGLRVSIRRAKQSPNDDDLSKEAIPHRRQESYTSVTDKFKYEESSSHGEFGHSSGDGYHGKGGYVLWFPGNMEYSEADDLLQGMIAQGLLEGQGGLISVAYEIIFYNSNFNAGLYYSRTLLLADGGEVIHGKRFIGFYPALYDKSSEPSFKYSLIAFRIMYFCTFLWLSLMVIKTLLSKIYEFATKRILEFMGAEIFDILLWSLSITHVYFWFTLIFAQVNEFKLPFTKSDFDFWSKYSVKTQSYLRWTGWLIALLGIRSIQGLQLMFPAFGVLFDTLARAKTYIIFFLVMSGTLLIGYSITAHLTFGIRSLDYAYILNSSMTLFQQMIGEIDFDTMDESNHTMALILWVPFMLLFFVIILNMFVAIVMATYLQLRKIKQRETEAVAKLMGEGVAQVKRKWLNLFCCIKPEKEQNSIKQSEPITTKGKSEEKKENVETKYTEQSEELFTSERMVDEIPKEKEEEITPYPKKNSKREEKEMSTTEIFCFNLSQLFLQRKNLTTKEEYEQSKNKMMAKIATDKEIAKVEEAKLINDVDNQYSLLVQAFIFFIYLVIYILMLLEQLNITVTNASEDRMRTFLRSNEIESPSVNVGSQSLESLKDPELILDWIDQVLFPIIYPHEDAEAESKEGFDPIYDHTLLFTNPLARITVRRLELQSNENSLTNGIIGKIRDKKIMSKDSSRFENEMTSDFIRNENKHVYDSSEKTAYANGGFIYYLTRNKTKSQNTLQQLRDDHLIEDPSFSLLSVEFITYLPNIGHFVYSSMTFTMTATGTIESNQFTKAVIMRLYYGHNKFRIIVEILFIVFTLYYLYFEIRSWLDIYSEYTENRNKDIRINSLPCKGCFDKFSIFLELDPEVLKKESCLGFLFSIIIAFIKLLLLWLFRSIKTTLAYMFRDPFNLLDLGSLIMSFQVMAIWIEMIINSINPVYNTKNEELIDQITDFSVQSELLFAYAMIHAINILFTFFRLLQFYKFSKRLSMFTYVMAQASMDIFFFMIMFFMIASGFTLMAYIVFGPSVEALSLINNAIAFIFTMLIGELDYATLADSDPFLAPYYTIAFMILFFLILLNMFVSILTAHYQELMHEDRKFQATEIGQQYPIEPFFVKKLGVIAINKMRSIYRLYLTEMLTADTKKSKADQKKLPYLINAFMSARKKKMSMLKKGTLHYTGELEMEVNEESPNIVKITPQEIGEMDVVLSMRPYLASTVTIESNGDELVDRPYAEAQVDLLIERKLNILENIKNEDRWTDIEKGNPLIWYQALEDILNQKTNHNITFSRLFFAKTKSKIVIENEPTINLNPMQMKFVTLTPEDEQRRKKWVSASTREQLEFWIAMDLENYNLVKYYGTATEIEEQKDNSPKTSPQIIDPPSPSLPSQKSDKIIGQSKDESMVLEDEEGYEDEEKKGIENLGSSVHNPSKIDQEDLSQELISFKKMQISPNYSFQPFNYISDIQLEFWRMLTKEQQYLLWFEALNAKQRIKLWNKLSFSQPYLYNVCRPPHEFRADKQYSTLNIQKAEELICGKKKLIWQKLIEITEQKSQFDMVLQYVPTTEERLPFWHPLTIEQKLDMLMNESIDLEAQVIIYLICMGEAGHHNLEQSDVILEREFDNRIYNKYIFLSQVQSAKCCTVQQMNRIKNLEKEDLNLLNLVDDMNSKVRHYKRRVDTLKMEVYTRNRQLKKKMAGKKK